MLFKKSKFKLFFRKLTFKYVFGFYLKNHVGLNSIEFKNQ